jgi:molecular chaperone DnaK
VEVSFDIDANGILNVAAKDLGTGKEQKVTITASTNLSKDDIDRMVHEAESHADQDRQMREEAETKNKGEQFAYSVERFMKESGDKVPSTEKLDIESKLESLKQALKEGDTTRIGAAHSALEAAFNQAAQAVYQQDAASAQSSEAPGTDGAGTSSAPADDDVVEAEFHSSEGE